MTLDEAAESLRISRNVADKLLRRGDWSLFSTRIGRKILVSRGGLEAWVVRRGGLEVPYSEPVDLDSWAVLEAPEKAGVYAVSGAYGWVKIGRAANIARRMDELQICNPVLLRFLATLSNSPEDERAIHQRWAHLRLRGEWFLGSTELLAYVREEAERCHSPCHSRVAFRGVR